MMAAVVDFESAPTDPKARASRLDSAYYSAYDAMRDEAESLGLRTGCNSRLSALFSTGNRLAGHWRARADKLERALYAALACDALSDEERARIIEALHGRGGRRRDAKLLTETEIAVLQHYRESAPADKQMVRTLLARLAELNPAAGDERRTRPIQSEAHG